MARARAQQQQIPGTERAEVPAVKEAAEDYRAFRDEHISVGEKAKAAKAVLIQRMKEHGLTAFVYLDEDGNERRVDLSVKENAKIKKVAGRGEDAAVEVEVDVH